tara:strand:- start:365 stop:577 length:213 start_codon:yes stop_codon:yes gene_type:complete
MKQKKSLKFKIGDLVRFSSHDLKEKEMLGLIIGTELIRFGYDEMIYHKIYTHENEIKDVYRNLIKEKICE